ncbi:acetolactate decarboxylase [Desulfosporosinus burensis]
MLSKESDTLYQVSTINSLLAGNYDGFQSVGKLKENGDIGIGTFDMLN